MIGKKLAPPKGWKVPSGSEHADFINLLDDDTKVNNHPQEEEKIQDPKKPNIIEDLLGIQPLANLEFSNTQTEKIVPINNQDKQQSDAISSPIIVDEK